MNPIVLEFLSELEKNNDRDWFNANKKRYEEAKKEVESFVNLLIPELARYDDSVRFTEAKECMFRIFRDVRFSHDKSPYKTNMGAWITRNGRKSSGPGYYIHIQPGESFLAAGIYQPEPERLKMIRNEIYYNIGEFKSILADRDVNRYSSGLMDFEKMKTAPRDFPKDFPDIDLLKYRHYTLSAAMKDSTVRSDDFKELVLSTFRSMIPFNMFLKRALEG